MENWIMPPEFHVFERDSQYLYLDPNNHKWFATDALGHAALSGFSRSSNVVDAVHQLSRFADLDDDAGAETFVIDLLQQLVTSGFLHSGQYELPKGPLQQEFPTAIYMHLTSACNLACTYCYNQEHRHQLNVQKKVLPVKERRAVGMTEKFNKVLSEAAELGIKQVKLTGGEATLFKDFIEVAKHAKSLGMNVNLLTNGGYINQDLANKIVGCVDSVSISLDSKTEDVHDKNRGKGSHSNALRAIGYLRNAGLQDLHVNGVMTPSSLDGAQELLGFALDDLHAESVTLAASSLKVRDPQDRWGASKTILSAEEAERIGELQYEFFKQRGVQAAVQYRGHCGVGRGVVSIEANGNVYPCQTLHEEKFLCGNAFKDSLRSILTTSSVTKATSELTVDNILECNICPVRYICHGGCRAEAYTKEGDINVRNTISCPSFYRSSVEQLWGSVA